jgi:hypothetical protein
VSGIYCDEINLSICYAIQYGHCAFGGHPKPVLVNSPPLTSTQGIRELLKQRWLAFSQNYVSFISKYVWNWMVDSGGHRHRNFGSWWIKDSCDDTYTNLVRWFYNYSVTLISGFRHDVEICAFLGYYAVSCGNYSQTFQDNILVRYTVPKCWRTITTQRCVIPRKPDLILCYCLKNCTKHEIRNNYVLSYCMATYTHKYLLQTSKLVWLLWNGTL